MTFTPLDTLTRVLASIETARTAVDTTVAQQAVIEQAADLDRAGLLQLVAAMATVTAAELVPAHGEELARWLEHWRFLLALRPAEDETCCAHGRACRKGRHR